MLLFIFTKHNFHKYTQNCQNLIIALSLTFNKITVETRNYAMNLLDSRFLVDASIFETSV